jgi:hypothetical protein
MSVVDRRVVFQMGSGRYEATVSYHRVAPIIKDGKILINKREVVGDFYVRGDTSTDGKYAMETNNGMNKLGNLKLNHSIMIKVDDNILETYYIMIDFIHILSPAEVEDFNVGHLIYAHDHLLYMRCYNIGKVRADIGGMNFEYQCYMMKDYYSEKVYYVTVDENDTITSSVKTNSTAVDIAYHKSNGDVLMAVSCDYAFDYPRCLDIIDIANIYRAIKKLLDAAKEKPTAPTKEPMDMTPLVKSEEPKPVSNSMESILADLTMMDIQGPNSTRFCTFIAASYDIISLPDRAPEVLVVSKLPLRMFTFVFTIPGVEVVDGLFVNLGGRVLDKSEYTIRRDDGYFTMVKVLADTTTSRLLFYTRQKVINRLLARLDFDKIKK